MADENSFNANTTDLGTMLAGVITQFPQEHRIEITCRQDWEEWTVRQNRLLLTLAPSRKGGVWEVKSIQVLPNLIPPLTATRDSDWASDMSKRSLDIANYVQTCALVSRLRVEGVFDLRASRETPQEDRRSIERALEGNPGVEVVWIP